MRSKKHHEARICRREFLQGGTALGLGGLLSSRTVGASGTDTAADSSRPGIRFGVTADAHLLGRKSPSNEAHFGRFVDEMKRWSPDFAIDLGDWACQVNEGVTTEAMHAGQLEALKHHVEVFGRVPCRRFHVIGNHDVGWLRGGDEKIGCQDLIGRGHAGEDITKQEWLSATGMSGRYYSFDAAGCHCIVLDGNNARDESAPPEGHDGVPGGYYIDSMQIAWLKEDLATHRDERKIVFSHQELHHTPPGGSGHGGDVPFPPVGKEGSYIDNGWQIRRLFAADGRVAACFSGHKHRNRWTIYGKTHYITMAATHWKGSFAAVSIADRLTIKGYGEQRSYDLPLLV